MKITYSQKQSARIKNFFFYSLFIVLIFSSVFKAYRKSFDLYVSVEQLLLTPRLQKEKLYLAGLVLEGSLNSSENKVEFEIYDNTPSHHKISAIFYGSPPRLLKENQEVLVYGEYEPNTQIFQIEKIASKHDEYYRVKKS